MHYFEIQITMNAGSDMQECDELNLAGLVDFDVTDHEVLERIDSVLAVFVNDLASGQLPSLTLVQRTLNNSTGHDLRLRLQQSTQTRSLVDRNGDSAFSYVRVFKILEVALDLVRSRKQATQRDLYYRLLSPPIFESPRHVNEAIQDAIALLRVPRAALGICCSGRGAVAGRLMLQERPGTPWLDCSTMGMDGKQISGDTGAILRTQFRTDASAIVVVEKDAIFQRLTNDRFFDCVPCILITAKGMPDLGTRVFLHSLHTHFPSLPVLGLVDFNPSGAFILSVYKYGSVRMGLEAPRYAVPGIAWLGARSEMLMDVDEDVWQPLTPRDRTLISTLRAGPLQAHAPGWLAELDHMEGSGSKAEIEALGIHELSALLQDLIIHKKYLN